MTKLDDVISLARGTPISEVIRQPRAEDFLSTSIYKMWPGIYLLISPFRPGSLEADSSGPFVNGLVWAPSDGAVRRALLMEIESDDGVIATVPDDFLPAKSIAATYGELLQKLKDGKPRVCQEKAAYRVASDGRFIHRMIETEQYSYFFRNNTYDDSELPYAIIRKLI